MRTICLFIPTVIKVSIAAGGTISVGITGASGNGCPAGRSRPIQGFLIAGEEVGHPRSKVISGAVSDVRHFIWPFKLSF